LQKINTLDLNLIKLLPSKTNKVQYFMPYSVDACLFTTEADSKIMS